MTPRIHIVCIFAAVCLLFPTLSNAELRCRPDPAVSRVFIDFKGNETIGRSIYCGLNPYEWLDGSFNISVSKILEENISIEGIPEDKNVYAEEWKAPEYASGGGASRAYVKEDVFISFGGIDWDYLNYGFRNNKNSIKWKEQDSDLDARHNIQLISLGAKICVWKFVALDFFGSELCGVGSIGQLAYDYTDNQGGKEHDVVSILFPTLRASVSLSLWRFTVKYGVDTYYLPSNILQGKLLGYDAPVQCRPTRCPKKMVISKEYGAISVRLGSF